jgi:5-methylcytosine-specific restriction protein A
MAVDEEDEISNEHHEGRIVVRLHKTRERDPQIVLKKRKSVLAQQGFLSCEACGINLEASFGSEKFNVYECHHLLPLHVSGETITKIEDLALLCPTCHRVSHRITPWPTLSDLKKIVSIKA